MQTEHRIDELIVDLSFNTTRLARHETALLSEWLSEDLLPALDGLFSHYCPGRQILRFETLEFDFGNLTSRHYQQAIREQLLKQFAQLLESQLLAVTPENKHLEIANVQPDKSNGELALKQLFSYLATGQLAAHRSAAQQQTLATKNKYAQPLGLHAQLLEAVIAQHNIADLLRELPQRDLLIQRLLTQFTLLQRMELLRQLAPQQVQNAIALFDLLQLLGSNYRITLSHANDQSKIAGLMIDSSTTTRLVTAHQHINYDSLGSDAVQQTIWEALLSLALAQPQATAQFWIDQILHRLASKFALSENQLRQDLVAIKLPTSAAAKALENLQKLIARTIADTNAAQVKANSLENHTDNPVHSASDNQNPFDKISPQSVNTESPLEIEQQSVGQLQQLVAAALIRADANQLQQLWPQLQAHDRLFLAALQHYLPQAEIRQQLMLRLPITLQADIIALLAPALTDIFYRLQQCATQLNNHIVAQLKSFTSLTASSEDNSQNQNAVVQQSAELVARQIWEITLGLLFNGTSSNSHYQSHSDVFLNALAQRYAELHNLDEQHLQQLLQQLLFGQQQDEASSSDDISSEKTESIHAELDGISPTAELQQNQQALQKNQEPQKNQQPLKNQEQQSSYPVSNATLVSAIVVPETSNFTADTSRFTADNSGFTADTVRLNSDTTRLTANSLVSVSDHQLFDLCLRLKSGALAWSSLAADVALLQRLISSYIRLGHSATAENCADFVAAIDAQAESSSAPTVFYLTVLQTLIADKLIDLELIAQTVQRNNNRQPVDAEIPSFVAQEAELTQGMNLLPDPRLPQKPMDTEEFTDTNIDSQQNGVAGSSVNNLTQEAAHSKQVPAELNTSSSQTVEIPAAATSAVKPDIEAITQELLRDTQPLLRLQQLQLNTTQWQELTFELLKRSSVVDVNTSADLVAAIELQACGLLNPTLYYRRIIQALLQQQPIDLEVFADTSIDSQQNDVADSGVNNLTQEVAYDKQVPAELNESSSQTVEIPATATSAVKPDIEAITQELLRDTQPLLRLQQLQLNTTQWQELTFELLKRGSVVDVNTSADLVAAIELQARGLLNPTLYYRRIIQALLQQQPIDLEVFADTNIDSQQNDVTDSDVNNLTQEVAHDKQVPAELNASSSHTAEIPTAATSAVKPDIEAITQELVSDSQPLLHLQQLQLNTTQWQELTFELLKRSSVADVNASTDLIAAIEMQARGVLNPTLYYRRTIQAILQRKPIDLEAFAVESIENPANASTQTAGRDLPLPVHTVEQMPRNSGAQSQSQNDIASTYAIAATDPIASIVKKLTTDTRPLLYLQQLQLDATQWQELAFELIKHNAVANVTHVINATDVADITDVASNTELIAAIKSQARSALNPIIYYRRIIQAVLQLQPIDLEAFAETTIADQQYTSANNSVDNVTQEGTIATHTDHSEYFNPESPGSKSLYPEQAMDYSLSTGTDTSVRKPAFSLAQLFAASQPLTQEQLLTLQQHVNLLLNHPNPTLVAEWSQLLALANNAQLLIQLVPSHLLHQIMLRLQPARYAALDAVVKVVLEALALLVNDLNNPAIKQARWKFIIRYLLATNDNQIATASNESAQTLSIELCEHLATAAGIDDLQRLVNLTQRRIVLLKPAAQLKPAMRLQEINTNSATQSGENTPQWESGLHIDNAGAVLAGAFLPRLFSMLNLIQDGKFIHPGAADRAVHLVQFMVTGASSTPEYDLILNKILCGISTSIPVSAGIEITEQEQTLIEQMLTSMIQHWKVLGSTSISGLRETFFQRQGWLILEEDCWRLKVKEQTFDLLLDRLPWSISLIKHGWMDKPLRVSWRNHS